MTSFLTAVFLLIVTPGPGVLSTAGIGSAYGARVGYRYVGGLFLGTNLVSLLVVSGFTGLVTAHAGFRQALLFVSAAYLLYLAFRIATAGSRIAFIMAQSKPGLKEGVLLQIVNPKAYIVNTTLFTGFRFDGFSPLQEILAKLLLINLIWIPIHLLWLSAGVGLRRLELPHRQQRNINIAMAVALVVVVGLAAFPELIR